MSVLFQKLFLIIFLIQGLFVDETINPQEINPHLDYKTKLGQVLMFNIQPDASEEFITKLIRDYKIGNFNLVGTYLKPENVKRIITVIQRESKKYLSYVPLIAVDEEGQISRTVFLKSIPQRDFKTEAEAYKEALRRGRTLKSLGFNTIFSPVLDYTTNKTDYIWARTFQKNQETSLLLAQAMIKGYRDSLIISIPKHFPGYINDNNDPHGTVIDRKTFVDYIESIDIFKQIMAKDGPLGLMFAHLSLKEYGETPITRSKTFVQDFLKDYKYYGLLVTDSLGMKSFKLDKNFEEATLESLLAGYDLLILSSNEEASLKVVDYLNSKVDDQNIQAAIDRSFFKITVLKQTIQS